MNKMLKLICLLAGFAMASFALPASADKVAQETICPSNNVAGVTPVCSPQNASLTRGGAPQSAAFQLNNISSDTGNSTVKSFKLFAPTASGVTIASAAGVAAGATANVSVSGFTATVQVLADGSAVYVNNINLPIKPFGPSFVLPMTVSVTCSATSSPAWTTMSGGVNQVWTSTGFTGQTFAINTTQHPANASQLIQNVSGVCSYTIGGSLSGLLASNSVVLQDNGGDNLTRSANGAFTFATPVASGSGYSVSVLTQPTGQTCSVTNGSGTVGAANVTNVSVSCTTNTYSIGGSVSGLTGSGLVLKDNGADNLAVPANATSFTFATSVAYNSGYAVTVFTQPFGQTCSVTNGSGTVGTANVTSVSVACTNNTMTVTVPHSAATNAGFDINVQLTGGSGGSVNVSSSDCSATFTGAGSYPVTTAAGGTNITGLAFSNPAGDTCHLTVDGSASGYGAAQTFSFFMYAGQIGCTEPNNFLSSRPAGDMTLDPYDDNNLFIGADPPILNGWGLRRGPNTDGNTCEKLNCTVTADTANHLVNVSCDKAGPSVQQNASFEYLVLWDPVPFDQDPFASKLPQLSWGVANPVYDANCTQGCDFVNALICHSDDNTASNAVVLPPIPNKPPFDAASNPQPQYLYDGIKQALACMAQQGSTPITGVGVQYWTKIIDRSDLGIKLP